MQLRPLLCNMTLLCKAPSGRGRGEGYGEIGRVLAIPMLPDADMKTAVCLDREFIGMWKGERY